MTKKTNVSLSPIFLTTILLFLPLVVSSSLTTTATSFHTNMLLRGGVEAIAIAGRSIRRGMRPETVSTLAFQTRHRVQKRQVTSFRYHHCIRSNIQIGGVAKTATQQNQSIKLASSKSILSFSKLRQQKMMTRLFASNEGQQGNSVTGVIYSPDNGSDDKDYPVVYLFTKEGCTLCDKVKDVLKSVRETYPHTLEAIDITDDDKTEWHSKYKYDIPVLHMNGVYWTKHRLTEGDAIDGLEEVMKSGDGSFEERSGEPDAGEMERRMEERRKNES